MAKPTPIELTTGFRIFPDYFCAAQCRLLHRWIESVLREAPLYTPHMPRSGRPMSVRMSNCGALGWYTDKELGYRYVDTHPDTGNPWPPICDTLRHLWRDVAEYRQQPEACLINFYSPGARMGLHRDSDEEAADAPVVSVSLGDSAVFRIGGRDRRSPTSTVTLASGSVAILGGPARHYFHGVDRIIAGSSDMIPGGGRFNLTLRRVTEPRN